MAQFTRLQDLDGADIDKGLVLFFPAPHSFTGEDVAEFQIHGARAVVARLLEVLTTLPGLRLAEAGEFTRRAFESGKLDLAEVEGLADLIDSETEWQRRQALRQMDGAIGRVSGNWRQLLVQAMALLAADLDFSDEGDVDGPLVEQARGLAGTALNELRQALGSFAQGERVREGFVVVLAGPPNAGKSSLLNALAQRDVAIVSPIAGTTRDAIEVRLDLKGLPVILIDTAGLRESGDEIETEGVRRALALAERADLILRIRAVNSEPDRLLGAGTVLNLATKADLGVTPLPGELAVSAQTGDGLPELLDAIAAQLSAGPQGEPALLTRQRHRLAVAEAIAALERAIHPAQTETELMAEDLRQAVVALERLIGRIGVESVLDQLFAGFCIGK